MIAITGVSGYIGVHLAHFLLDKKEPFIGLLKQNTAQIDLDLLHKDNIPFKLVNFFDETSIFDAIKGCNRIIHLVGSIYAPKDISLENLHKDITFTMLSASKKAEIKKIVYLSALGTAPDAISEYHRTKSLAEEQVKQSGIPYIILQPSLVFGRLYGHRNSKLIARFANLTEKLSRIPVVGNGQNKMQPIYISDLIECIYQSISETLKNKTIQIGGPDILTLKQIAQIICQATSKREKPFIYLPRPLMYIIASIMEKIKDKPDVTRDQITMSKQDNICTSNDMDLYFKLRKSSLKDMYNQLL